MSLSVLSRKKGLFIALMFLTGCVTASPVESNAPNPATISRPSNGTPADMLSAPGPAWQFVAFGDGENIAVNVPSIRTDGQIFEYWQLTNYRRQIPVLLPILSTISWRRMNCYQRSVEKILNHYYSALGGTGRPISMLESRQGAVPIEQGSIDEEVYRFICSSHGAR